MLWKSWTLRLFACFLAILFSFPFAHAQSLGDPAQKRPLITQSIDEGSRVQLEGNRRPEANAQNDRGPVADDMPMEHLLLQLKRSPEQEKALQQFIDELHTMGSPDFHQWISAQEFGQRFGLAQQDLDTVTRWLESHGFLVNLVYPSGTLIDFSGTAGQVQEAFLTEIHELDVRGVKHFANMQNPQIPAALSPVVVGVVSLHDFRPRPMYKPRANYTFTLGGSTYQAVVPGDLATIYNLNPLFSGGTSGQGQTIVVIEDTNVFSTSDWTTFRSTFGLSSYTSGSFSQVNPAPPSGTNNCTNSGVNGNDGEAILDAEYASAAAPSAAIKLASCSDTATTFGGLIALQNLINSGAPPAIVSISYGECEAANGAAANAAYISAYQQGVAEGVSVFVSAGDEGAASCDADSYYAAHGIGVSGFASTPYNVAVGGTDFGDSYAGTNSTYWNSTNTATYESAKSYVPEIPWNDSCASALISSYLGFSTTYGSSGFCNSSTGAAYFLTTVSGSGGPSGCATGSPTTPGVVSGTCAGGAKPSWQSVVGNPKDGVRDLPDVSLFAANGVWGHYYVFCYSDTANGGVACTGAPSGWAGAGGTSFSSPILAGIQALVNQKTGARQGNPNPVYYQLAATEYGGSGNGSCNSTLGNGVASTCVFYDVTQGDMDVNCAGTYNCYDSSAGNGVLSTSNSAYAPAYGTTTGWDFATGIGTVNAANLVNAWSSVQGTPTASASPATLAFGTQGVNNISAAKTVTLTNNSSSAAVTISSIAISGTNAADFVQSATTCGSSLAANASCTISVTFTPAATGAMTATLSIADSATNSPQTVSLTGTGVGQATTSVTTLAFGNQGLKSTSAAKTVTLTNNDSTALTLSGRTITGTNASAFAISATTCGSSLAANTTCNISVTFTPAATEAMTATLSIADSATNSPQTVSLTGTGVGQATTSVTTLAFGNQGLKSTSAAKTVTLTNNDSTALTLSGRTIAGTNASAFAISATTCSTSLGAHASCTISVTFTPAATGAMTATLSIADSATNSPQTVSLSGAGVAP